MVIHTRLSHMLASFLCGGGGGGVRLETHNIYSPNLIVLQYTYYIKEGSTIHACTIVHCTVTRTCKAVITELGTRINYCDIIMAPFSIVTLPRRNLILSLRSKLFCNLARYILFSDKMFPNITVYFLSF